MIRIERQIGKLEEKISALVAEQESAEFGADQLLAITNTIGECQIAKAILEDEWLVTTEKIDK